MAELGEVAIKRADAAAETGTLFEQDDVVAAFGGFKRGGDAGNAAADDENGLAVGPAGLDDCVLPRLEETCGRVEPRDPGKRPPIGNRR